MLLQVFFLGLFSVFASDFLTLSQDTDLIEDTDMVNCDGDQDFRPVPVKVDGEVPIFRSADHCHFESFRYNDEKFTFYAKSLHHKNIFIYLCEENSQTGDDADFCKFHKEGQNQSLHFRYDSATLKDIVGLSWGFQISVRFYDEYNGHEKSYGNFVYPFHYSFDKSYTWRTQDGKGIISHGVSISLSGVVSRKLPKDLTKPPVNPLDDAYRQPLILSVSVYGRVKSTHYIHSCLKETPDGDCKHFRSRAFSKESTDMITMALPNNEESYYFENAVFKFGYHLVDAPATYTRIIFKTDIIEQHLIDDLQKRVLFSSVERDSDIFIAANLMRCQETFKACMNGQKKSYKLTLYGFTEIKQVQEFVVNGEAVDTTQKELICEPSKSRCVIKTQLFSKRNTPLWLSGKRDSCNEAIPPDAIYKAMPCPNVTIVIELGGVAPTQ